MKILVTGATGLVGSVLTRHLVNQGAAVRILRRPTSRLDLLAEVQDQVEHAVGDVTDPPSVAAAMAGVTHVYHTAGLISLNGARDRDRLFAVNVAGTAHVVNAALAAGVVRLVHTSSIAALGRPEDLATVIDETIGWTPHQSTSFYARSKYQGELEVYRGIAEGLDAVVVNPSLIFGVALPGTNTRRLVERVRDGTMPACPPGGTNAVDVVDVVDGHLRAMAHGRTGERYLLTGENLGWRQLIDQLAQAFGVTPPRWTVPPAVLQVGAVFFEALAAVTRTPPRLSRELARRSGTAYRYTNDKAVAELGCSFRPFRETAARLAESLPP